ncbi:MAG TPA: sugar phosphate isomerase/epimerase family protein [Mycobacteriales bacterium]|jgi:sugar phosphate isomerase/epimerase|nr:sugar phosphate isomerase/epimerase family protein [Mycobacteriales bacterium]
MWTLSGFADEISDDLGEQCDLLGELGMANLEFRSVGGTNVAALTDDQLTDAAATLDRRGVSVTCIGSPLGKSKITDPFEDELPKVERSLRAAQILRSPFVRVFSFFLPPGEDPTRHRDEVLRRMSHLAREAERAGVTLLLENETKVYGETPERCVDIFDSVGSAALRATWDSANFVHAGLAPFTDAYPIIRPYLVHLQIKDCARNGDGNLPAGQGDGQIPETIAALRDSGFDGVLSLEPHLSRPAEGMIGFSGPELFSTAAKALTGLLADAAVQWN